MLQNLILNSQRSIRAIGFTIMRIFFFFRQTFFGPVNPKCHLKVSMDWKLTTIILQIVLFIFY